MSTQKEVERNCRECDGTGGDRNMKLVHFGEKIEFRPCAKCGGTGWTKDAAN